LVAELTDVDGWAMLIALARAEGHDKMADEFDAAYRAEETHLSSVRQWLLELTNGEAKVIKPS
jgi:rubrerythrin